MRAKLRGRTGRVPRGRVRALARLYDIEQIAVVADEPLFGTCATRGEARTPSAPLTLASSRAASEGSAQGLADALGDGRGGVG